MIVQYSMSRSELDKERHKSINEMPSVWNALEIQGKINDEDRFEFGMLGYLYNGDGSELEKYPKLSAEDYQKFPILKKIKGSTVLNSEKYPIGQKVTETSGFYLRAADTKVVRITLKQSPYAEIWLKGD